MAATLVNAYNVINKQIVKHVATKLGGQSARNRKIAAAISGIVTYAAIKHVILPLFVSVVLTRVLYLASIGLDISWKFAGLVIPLLLIGLNAANSTEVEAVPVPVAPAPAAAARSEAPSAPARA